VHLCGRSMLVLWLSMCVCSFHAVILIVITHCLMGVAQWLGRWLVIERSRIRLVASPLPSNNSGQVVHTHVPLSPSSIIWYRPKGIVLPSSAAGKVTVGLASHWPCVADSVVYPPMGSKAKEREMSTPPTLRRGTARFLLLSVAAAWLGGSIVSRIDQVTQHPSGLDLSFVTVHGYTVFIFDEAQFVKGAGC